VIIIIQYIVIAMS